MPILVKGKLPPTAVSCVREVRVGVPLERMPEVEHFYIATLGLETWPAEHQIPGGWGLGNPQCGLYLEHRHDPEVNPVRRRFTLTAPSLAIVEERLAASEWPYERVRGFGICERYLLVHDPAGHLIEVRQSLPL